MRDAECSQSLVDSRNSVGAANFLENGAAHAHLGRSMKLLSSFVSYLLAVGTLFAAESNSPRGKAEHVLLVVWDGMRPDFVSPHYTPTLYQLAQDGVFFKNHHPVYVSSTEVNGTALATGVYPNRSGIIGNRDYRPELGWLDSLGTETLEAIRRSDLLTGGKFIAVPTVAETLQA